MVNISSFICRKTAGSRSFKHFGQIHYEDNPRPYSAQLFWTDRSGCLISVAEAATSLESLQPKQNQPMGSSTGFFFGLPYWLQQAAHGTAGKFATFPRRPSGRFNDHRLTGGQEARPGYRLKFIYRPKNDPNFTIQRFYFKNRRIQSEN